MKRTPGDTVAEREQYWIEIIEEGRRYPGGVTAFCRDRGISKNNYYSWFKRLRKDHPEWNDLAKDAIHRARQTKAKRKEKAVRETEVEPKPRRQRFTAKEKARILRLTDAAAPGQIAAILRREGLYASTLHKWRAQREERALEPKKRGRKADPQAAHIKQLEAKVAQLERKIKQKDMLLDLQKKIAEILESTKEQEQS